MKLLHWCQYSDCLVTVNFSSGVFHFHWSSLRAFYILTRVNIPTWGCRNTAPVAQRQDCIQPQICYETLLLPWRSQRALIIRKVWNNLWVDQPDLWSELNQTSVEWPKMPGSAGKNVRRSNYLNRGVKHLNTYYVNVTSNSVLIKIKMQNLDENFYGNKIS